MTRDLAQRGYTVVASGRERRRGRALAQIDGIEFIGARLENANEVDGPPSEASTRSFTPAPRRRCGEASARSCAPTCEAPKNIISAAERFGVGRLVHISTPSVYFDFGDRLDVREDAPFGTPINAYMRTKITAEHDVQAAARRGMHTTVIRPRANLRSR